VQDRGRVPGYRVGGDCILRPQGDVIQVELHPGDTLVVRSVGGNGDATRNNRRIRRIGDGYRRGGRVAQHGGADFAGRGTDVTGRVHGGHPVIIGAGRQPHIEIAGGCRLGNQVGGAGDKSGRCRAVHVVVNDADVVDGGGPVERRGAHGPRRRQVGGRRRRRR